MDASRVCLGIESVDTDLIPQVSSTTTCHMACYEFTYGCTARALYESGLLLLFKVRNLASSFRLDEVEPPAATSRDTALEM